MSFSKAFSNLIGYEGGYVNDPDDSGKETYMGISRVYYPAWIGWRAIESYKTLYPNDFAFQLKNDDELTKDVIDFYKKEYWDKFNGDRLPEIIAEELFEQSVNLGNWKTAGKQLQRGLNLLNRNGKLFDDLKVDGYVGDSTLDAVNRVKERRLLKVLNGLQFMRYYNLDIKNPVNEKFAGWFDRV